ncbi:lipid A deacylase LpxR family protein, partial [Bacteroides ovatus]
PKYVNKYPVVGEWGYGFGLRYKRSELLFGLHYMTKEYTQQESMQCVGVLQLRHTF